MRGFDEVLLGMQDRVACLDPGLSGLFHGACVYPINVKQDGLARVAHVLMQEEITVYLSVATTFRHFVSALTTDAVFPKLRLIMLHGELLYKRDVELYKRHFSPECVLVNGLASTEAGSIARYLIDHETQIAGDIVPVGYPTVDKDILLLDDAGHEVAPGQIGEIAVRSAYLSPGYWRRPELTRAAFIPDPHGSDTPLYRTGDVGRWLPDGSLVLVERKDFQVKIRGNRVEVAEIEMALLGHQGVQEAVVVHRHDDAPTSASFDSGGRLVAYIVPAVRPAPTISALRQTLATTLPDYMMPAAFVMLDALPLTGTGKVDRRALPAPPRVRPDLATAFVAPRTPVETVLAQLWAELLGLQEVGIHDRFLDLGGDSLLATQVMSRVIHTFKVDVPLRALFESPTVASMAMIITHYQAHQAQDIERLLAELEALGERAE